MTMQVTQADRDAARRILGQDRSIWTMWSTMIRSSDGTREYEVMERPDTVYGGTYLFCSCPGWSFQKGKGKDCRHVIEARVRRGQLGPASGPCDDCGWINGQHNPAIEH